MPTVQVKTTSSKEVWKTPDGKMKIHEIELDHNGKSVRAKTYSDAISQVGWEGEVETYEKSGRNGSETFVKQPQKEGYQNSQSSGASHQGASYQSKRSAPQSDNYTMYLSYVKDIAVALIMQDTYSQEQLARVVEEVGVEGKHLYSLRHGAEESESEGISHAELNADAEDLRKSLKADKLSNEEDPWSKDKQITKEELDQLPL